MEKILIIEDELDIAELIRFNLERNQFEVHEAHDGLEGAKAIKNLKPDLIILDVMMPKYDGFQVLSSLREDKELGSTPVIMLTARGQSDDRILGLEKGADDYMTKPFSPKELVLRVKAILKRSKISSAATEIFQCKPFSFNKSNIQFYANDELIDLTSTEFKLMLFLCNNANTVLDRQKLLSEVWGYNGDVSSRTLDTHMKRLRQKLGPYSDHLETVRGVGYKVVPSN